MAHRWAARRLIRRRMGDMAQRRCGMCARAPAGAAERARSDEVRSRDEDSRRPRRGSSQLVGGGTVPAACRGKGDWLMNEMIWVIGVVAVLVIAGAAIYIAQRQRSRQLRTHFGPEYD